MLLLPAACEQRNALAPRSNVPQHQNPWQKPPGLMEIGISPFLRSRLPSRMLVQCRPQSRPLLLALERPPRRLRASPSLLGQLWKQPVQLFALLWH
jgi:hypothetical protein